MQFGRGCPLWGRVCPLSPPHCLLPPAGDGPVHSPLALLWYLLSPLFLSNATHSSPFRPPLLVAVVRVWGIFLLGVTFRHVICGFYYFSSQLGCPPRFKNFPQTRRRVSWCLETSSIKTPFPGWIAIPDSFVSFYLLYFVLPPFEDNGLLFWAPDVLC